MKRIVVGVDGSAGAANAMRWANRLAAVHGAELIVMSGFVPTESELPPGRVEELLGERRRSVKQWTEAAVGATVPMREVVERGDPRPGILRVAAREDADLIVVGRAGTSAGPGLLHIGSMAEYLAHNSDRPLAVVGGAVNVEIRSALVGVDGSAGSHVALAWVADLASRSGLRIVAACVESPSTGRGDGPSAVEDRIRTELAVDLTTAGVTFDARVLSSTHVADALLQAARDERTDVVVVGMRGLGGYTGLRIGGVALKVLHRADRPVVLFPEARR